MPYIKIEYSGTQLTGESYSNFQKSICSTASKLLNKPEDVFVIQIEFTNNLYFGNNNSPCAMVHIESIGGTFESLCQPLSDVINSFTNIPNSRMFLNFRDVTSENWGWKGQTIKALFS